MGNLGVCTSRASSERLTKPNPTSPSTESSAELEFFSRIFQPVHMEKLRPEAVENQLSALCSSVLPMIDKRQLLTQKHLDHFLHSNRNTNWYSLMSLEQSDDSGLKNLRVALTFDFVCKSLFNFLVGCSQDLSKCDFFNDSVCRFSRIPPPKVTDYASHSVKQSDRKSRTSLHTMWYELNKSPVSL